MKPIVRASSKIPPTTMVEVVATTAKNEHFDTLETDKEGLGVAKAQTDLYDDLDDLKGDFVQVVTEACLRDTTMVGSSGSETAKETVSPTSMVRVELGIDAQVEATPVSQSSPQT